MNHDGIREQLNIVYCPRCRVDTMPSDLTGNCFFCDTQIAEPLPGAKIEEGSRYCAHCDGEISPTRGGKSANAIYCSENCRRRGWDKTPAGIESRKRRVAKVARRKWLARREAGIPEEPWKARKQAA